MAKYDYNKIFATAQRLISKFGNPVTMTRMYSLGNWTKDYNPVSEGFTWTNTSTGAVQSVEPEDATTVADGILVGISDTLLDNSLVRKSDSELLILNINDPQVGDIFTVNGRYYKYIAHETVNPAGITVLYKIALRI